MLTVCYLSIPNLHLLNLLGNVKVYFNPTLDLSWTGIFPHELGWRGSVLAVAILFIVYTACYFLVTIFVAKWTHRRSSTKFCSLRGIL